MANLQQKTKSYLYLAGIMTIVSILLLGVLQSWQPNTPFAESSLEAIKIVSYLSLIPIGFVLLAIGSQKNNKILRIAGTVAIATELVLTFILG